jgi:hypothetical protein
MEPRAASQLPAPTAAVHRASKAVDHLSAALILLALRRHRNRTQRNNARLWSVVASLRLIAEVSRFRADDEESQDHQHNVCERTPSFGSVTLIVILSSSVIELADNRLLLRTIASEVDGSWVSIGSPPFLLVSMRQVAGQTRQRT